MKKIAVLSLLLLLAACQNNSGSGPVVETKLWSNPQNWPNAAMPSATSDVTIPVGQTFILDTNTTVNSITVMGTLLFADQDLSLTTTYLMVHGPGKLQIGSASKPFAHQATITLIGNDPTQDVMGMGSKFVGVMMGGDLEIYGPARVNWTKLNATAAQGATQIVLADPVDWQVGETIVIASSDLDPSEAETHKITAVSGDKHTITLDQPLANSHYGQVQSFAGKTLDERAEVGLLSRSIVIQSSPDSTAGGFGGHVMVMGSSPANRETNPALSSSAHIQGVEFRRMGQYQMLGRYPFHWHRNGNSSGNFIQGSAFHDNFQRGIVVHGSDNATVKDNVVYGSIGHSFMTEDGSETNNTFDHNLGIYTQAFSSVSTNAIQAAQNDTQAATFWIKGPNNSFINNAAAGGQNSGFWFDSVGPVDQSKFVFQNNVAHSYQVGRQVIGTLGGRGAVWITGTSQPQYSFHGPFTLTNMTLYKNREAYWANPANDPTGPSSVDINNSIFADNSLATSSHGLRDSVIVGKSANPDPDPLIGRGGVQEYQATSYLKNVQFFNFSGNNSALVSRDCFRDGGDIITQGIQMTGAQVQLCPLGNNDIAIFDQGGQIFGGGSPVTIIPGTSPALFDGTCSNTLSNTRLCPGTLQYLNLTLETDKFYMNQVALPAGVTPPNLIRDDATPLPSSDIVNAPFYWTLIKGHSYQLGSNLSNWQYLRFRAFNKYLSDGNAQRGMVLNVPAASNFTASRCDLEPTMMGTSCTNKAPLTQVSSLDALNASTTAAYFYDSPAMMIRLKMVSNTNTSVLLQSSYMYDRVR